MVMASQSNKLKLIFPVLMSLILMINNHVGQVNCRQLQPTTEEKKGKQMTAKNFAEMKDSSPYPFPDTPDMSIVPPLPYLPLPPPLPYLPLPPPLPNLPLPPPLPSLPLPPPLPDWSFPFPHPFDIPNYVPPLPDFSLPPPLTFPPIPFLFPPPT